MVQANPGGRAPRRTPRRGAAASAVPLALLLALAGCASGGVATGVSDTTWFNPLGLGAAPTVPPPAEGVTVVVRPADPIAVFVARAQPGQQESLALPGSGTLVTARYARSYNAASGRECREIQLSSGGGTVYCRDPAVGWIAARPLLRGGAVFRP